MLKENKIKILADSAMVLGAIIWGCAFVVVKTSLDAVSPSYLIAFRTIIALIATWIIFHKRLRKITLKELAQGSVIGVMLYLGYYLQTCGLQYTTVGKNAFLTSFYVVAVPFLNWAFRKIQPDKFNIISALLCLSGVGLLSLQGDLTMNYGDFLTLLCGLAFSCQIVAIGKMVKDTDPIRVTFLQFPATAICAIIVGAATESLPTAITWDFVLSMLYLGLLSMMVVLSIQNIGIKYTSAARASVIMSAESVFAAVLGAIVLSEEMSPRMIMGCCIIFVSIIISETKLEFFRKKPLSKSGVL